MDIEFLRCYLPRAMCPLLGDRGLVILNLQWHPQVTFGRSAEFLMLRAEGDSSVL